MTVVSLAACNFLSGASDLQVLDKPPVVGTGLRDAATDTPASALDASTIIDGAVGDGMPDAGCTSSVATSLFGAATALAPYTLLTPEMNDLAGGIASAGMLALTDFEVSFAYSMTHTSANQPAAGIAFFAIAAQPSALTCQTGPYLCALGATAPGFAVIVRTSRASAGDPMVPYVAVVDAQTYPDAIPQTRTNLDPSRAYELVPAPNTGVPTMKDFHEMVITIRSGKVSATIDGAAVLTSVPIPSWVPGRLSTWGLGASTGQAAGFATRIIASQATLTHCP
jgi:hypothetical protein